MFFVDGIRYVLYVGLILHHELKGVLLTHLLKSSLSQILYIRITTINVKLAFRKTHQKWKLNLLKVSKTRQCFKKWACSEHSTDHWRRKEWKEKMTVEKKFSNSHVKMQVRSFLEMAQQGTMRTCVRICIARSVTVDHNKIIPMIISSKPPSSHSIGYAARGFSIRQYMLKSCYACSNSQLVESQATVIDFQILSLEVENLMYYRGATFLSTQCQKQRR